MNDDDTVTCCLYFCENMCGKHDGLCATKLADEVADFNYLIWIETAGRFIRIRTSGSWIIAWASPTRWRNPFDNSPMSLCRTAAIPQTSIISLRRFFNNPSFSPCKRAEYSRYSKHSYQDKADSFPQIADFFSHFKWMLGDIESFYFYWSWSRRHVASDNLHRGGLPSAIRARKPRISPVLTSNEMSFTAFSVS